MAPMLAAGLVCPGLKIQLMLFLHCRVMGTFSTRFIIHQAEIISIMIEFSWLSVKTLDSY